MENNLQFGFKRLAIADIKIKTNGKTRESRLFKSSWEHIRKSLIALFNSYTMYKPYAVFLTLGLILLVCGLIPFVHYLYIIIINKQPFGTHHLQSLIVGTVLLNASFISFTLGIVANLIRINRTLIEDILEEQRRHNYGMSVKKPDSRRIGLSPLDHQMLSDRTGDLVKNFGDSTIRPVPSLVTPRNKRQEAPALQKQNKHDSYY